ncbi:MAG: acetyltransferase [Acidobacteriota bacterium]
MNPFNGRTGEARRTALAMTIAAALPSFLYAQNLMQGLAARGSVQLLTSDSAILETEEAKKDLPCTVTSVKPLLGFDLRFHTGYDIVLPLREIAGDGDQLTIVFKVTSNTDKDAPSYFSQKYTVPTIDADAKGDAWLQGGFDVGEGSYHVSWMMRDRMERVCSSGWDITATLPAKDQGIKLAIPANTIDISEREFFKDEPPVTRLPTDEQLNVKVLINFAPQRAAAAAMQPIDTSALVSILRNISREPRIRKFSVVAFNMNDQRVVYRQENTDQIDFPELGKALATLKLGMVDYKKLTDKRSETDFLTKLIQDELGHNTSDAVIFAGPKVMLDEAPSPDSFKDIAASPFPVFYMNYNLMPQQNPWRDSIGTVVKKLRGYEYTISRPRDLWNAWTDIMGRIVKLKLVATGPASSQ